jgi:hypothetical protein
MRIGLLVTLVLMAGAQAARAQAPADTAAIILDAARALRQQGRTETAHDLLRYLQSRYGTTPAARTADSLLRGQPAAAPSGSGRTGFITFNTLYGAFLGLAVPASFDANAESAAGLGLLIGAPAGFFLSRAFARQHFHSSGQAGTASFATAWGTWQGLALQQMLDLGDRESCNEFGCFTDASDSAPWAAMALGGLAGIGIGWAIASAKNIPPGTASLVSHSAFWGSWFGVSIGEVAGLHEDGLFAATLLTGSAALLAAIPAAAAWQPSASRVRLATAAGLAGGLAGAGVDLLTQPDDERASFAIPAATSALGLLIGALATRHQRDLDTPEPGPEANALLQWRDGLRLQLAFPEPARFMTVDRAGRLHSVPGARLTLFDARF